MHHKFKTALLAMIFVLLTACGAPTLDTSSDEKLEQSLQAMIEKLPENEQSQVAQTVMGMYMMSAFAAFGGEEAALKARKNLDAELHGKTAKEILALRDKK